MSEENQTVEEPQILSRVQTSEDRIKALVEIHNVLSEIQPPKSFTLAKVYADALSLLAEVANSLIEESQETTEE